MVLVINCASNRFQLELKNLGFLHCVWNTSHVFPLFNDWRVFIRYVSFTAKHLHDSIFNILIFISQLLGPDDKRSEHNIFIRSENVYCIPAPLFDYRCLDGVSLVFHFSIIY